MAWFNAIWPPGNEKFRLVKRRKKNASKFLNSPACIKLSFSFMQAKRFINSLELTVISVWCPSKCWLFQWIKRPNFLIVFSFSCLIVLYCFNEQKLLVCLPIFTIKNETIWTLNIKLWICPCDLATNWCLWF